MSRTYSKLTNKHQKYPKVHFQQYLYGTHEPQGYISNDSSTELDMELSENSESMRQSFRHLAKRIRNR